MRHLHATFISKEISDLSGEPILEAVFAKRIRKPFLDPNGFYNDAKRANHYTFSDFKDAKEKQGAEIVATTLHFPSSPSPHQHSKSSPTWELAQ